MLRRTPPIARLYLLVAACLLALPALGRLYEGATGKLLVATYGVDREPFRQSVVYMVHHDLFGAWGFIVNKPATGHTQTLVGLDLNVLQGGPVRPQDPAFLIGQGGGAQEPVWVFPRPGQTLDDPQTLARVKQKISTPLNPPQIVFGYAGWTVLQLDWEISRGRWVVIDADSDLLFHTPVAEIWSKALQKARNQNRIDTEREPI